MVRRGFVVAGCLTFAALMLVPVVAFAQAGSGIAGVVKDTSGAVMPGVTVEATSPVLIEKVRTAVTDDQGQYKLVDLQTGAYSVSFTLTGFNTVRREGIELPANFTATVNAEMRVGSLEETLTVTGSSPVVDAQSTVQGTVVNRDLITALPTARNFEAIAQTIPGMTVGAIVRPTGQDVGGLSGERAALMIHGSRQNDFNTYLEGLSVGALNSNWSSTSYTINPTEVQEFSYTVGAASAQYPSGGVAVNIIPKVGGNQFAGTAFGSYSGEGLQSSNLEGLANTTAVNKLLKIYDLTGSFGGPIKQDKLWFYAAGRYLVLEEGVANMFYPVDPAAYTYTPDLSRPALDDTWNRHEGLRLTWQATPKNRITAYGQEERRASYHYMINGSVTPEAIGSQRNPVNTFLQASWNAPVTNRLLFEAGTLLYKFNSLTQPQPEVGPNALSARELSTGLLYRSAQSYSNTEQYMRHFRGGVNYVTGSHAFKAGFSLSQGRRPLRQYTLGDLNLQFLNGVPRSVIQHATPFTLLEKLNSMFGLYAQDQWTVGRVTLNGGLRFDYHNSMVPAQDEPSGQFVSQRSFAAIADVPKWYDVSPRMGVAYDLFGTGKTAIKATLSRYIGNESLTFARANNPVQTSVNSATRTWNDVNGNFYPDCDFVNIALNGECGAISNVNFGKPVVTTRYDDAIREGWGVRPNNWEVTAGIQHELRSGIAVNASYYRRWYGSFTVTDNEAVTPANFDPYCITAPTDSRLPGGGGYPICGLYDINPTRFGQVNNLVTSSESYGEQSEIYNGIDFTVNARLGGGAVASGGVNLGRVATNNCFAVDSPQQAQERFCRVTPPFFRPQYRMLASYPLPWALLVSGTFQSLPGPEITASYVATNAQIAPALGRNLAAGANGTVTIPLIESGTMFGERLYQVDGRLSRIFKFGRTRIQANLDLYNLTNSNAVLVLNTNFGPDWQRPSYVLPGRLVKFSAEVDF